MPRNGSGTYSRAVADYVFDTVIDETAVNSEMADIATALTASIAKDGQTVITANLPMAGFKHTGVGDGSARADSPSLAQVQDAKLNWVAAGGTADVITAAYSPAITAVADGLLLCIRALGANTVTTPSFSPNGLTARTIVKNGGVALAAGDIVGAGHELLLRYLAASTRWELLNPKGGLSDPMTTRGDVLLRNASNVTARLGIGAAKTALVSDGTDLAYAAVLQPGVTNTLTKGFDATPNAAGTKSSGTFTPAYSDGNYQTATNGGAHTLGVPTGAGSMRVVYTNNGSAGAITTSGFTKVIGSFTTTNGHIFHCFISTETGSSLLNIVAMQ